MPFIKTDEGILWKESTPEDVKEIRDDILSPPEPPRDISPVELDNALRERVESSLSSIIPGYGLEILGSANEKLYNFIKNHVDKNSPPVDIIVPVHNAIHIAEDCIASVLSRTYYPYRLTIVDDASDAYTQSVLDRLAEDERVTLIRNKKNRGFAATVNRGMRATSSPYICLLNSDVLVTDYWLTKMMIAMADNPRNKIVNPATNNTALIDIPLSPGCSYLTANKVFEKYSHHNYPEIMPTGFCFLFPRELVETIGLFDEAYKNFGEESHFWMQVITRTEGSKYPRYRAVMADDTYCFHERGSSFSSKEGEMDHMSIRKTAATRFNKIWPQYAHWRKTYSVDKALGNLRSPMPPTMINEEASSSDRMCWVVRSTASGIGAMKYIADIVNEINERGGDARVAHVLRDPETDLENIRVLPELRTAPIVFKSDKEFVEQFADKVFKRGIVVASTVELSGMVKEVCENAKNLQPLLHVQSYEPDLTEDTKLQRKFKQAFKEIPHVISNSGWITDTLQKEKLAEPFATIAPGVDQRLFYSKDRETGDERPTIMVPILKNFPYRGPDRAIKLIGSLIEGAKKRNMEIRILCPGVDVINNSEFTVPLGNVAQTRMATLLATEVDVFVDPSYIHSYGLPCLEAIACGAYAVSWDNKGIHEYLIPGDAGYVFPKTTNPSVVAEAILERLSGELPSRTSEARSKILAEHNRDVSVDSFIKAVQKRFSTIRKTRRIVFVTPHLRKWGGPTTILHTANALAARGHDVSITSVYSDINPSVMEETELPIDLNPHEIRKCDVLISNSDNPMNAAFMNMGHAKKKVMFKMSHNARFKQLENDSLKLPWDGIFCTTDWLVNVCKEPLKDWDHQPRPEARRVGWFHYTHDSLKVRPEDRKYGDLKDRKVVIGGLIHRHPLKGTTETLNAMGTIQSKYGGKVGFVGIGEVPLRSGGQPVFKPPHWMQYVMSPTREELADTLRQVDIWIGASHTEGLGRMALEAMSCSVACVLTNTGAEFAQHTENCMVVPINDVQEIVNAVDYLIRNPEVRTRISREGYRTACAFSDPTACIDELEAAINEVCDDAGK